MFLVLGREHSRFYYKRLPIIDEENAISAQRMPVMLLRRQDSVLLLGQGLSTFGDAQLPITLFLREHFITESGTVMQVFYSSRHWKKIHWEGIAFGYLAT